jgi:hypothetical protein
VLGYNQACPSVSWHFWPMSIVTEAIKEYMRKATDTNTANEWAWSPLTVSEVSRSLDDKEVEALSTPCTIPSVGFEWPLRFPLRYK